MIYVPGKFVYYHIPKTGGSWFILNCQANIKEEIYLGDDPHWTKDMFKEDKNKSLWNNIKDLPSVAFVRNPIDWYMSYWSHKCKEGWAKDRNVWWYNTYLGKDFNDIKYILRQEDCRKHSMWLLDYTETKYDVQKFRNFPKNNIGNYSKIAYPEYLKHGIRFAERKIFEAFNY